MASESRLKRLKASLEILEIPIAPGDHIEDRVQIQKAVCLTQLLGAPLGYRFSWYKRGPYSPDLASDLHALIHRHESIEPIQVPEGRIQDAFENTRRVLSYPKKPASMSPASWAELVTSLAFLIKKAGLQPEEAEKTIQEEKPDLADHLVAAGEALKMVALLA